MQEKNKRIKKQSIKKKCTSCGRELSLSTGFYSTKSPLYAIDGKINICKECFISNSLNEETGEIDEGKFKNLLRKTDFPFYKDNLQSAVNQFTKEHSYIPKSEIKNHGVDIIKLYMKNVNSLRQLAGKSFEDSEKDGFVQKRSTVLKGNNEITESMNRIEDKTKESRQKKAIFEKEFNNSDDFNVTEEMVQLFGEGYDKDEYRKMYKKYEKLKLNYTLQTNLHQEALATYVRFKVKEEDATARGDVDEAKKWYDAAQNAAASGKLTPKQLSEADLQGGINNFSEIFKAVEQAVDIIPILPRFKYRPNDALDFNIWCYINYARELQGLPQCDYEDVYRFYDRKKEEYLEQYGDPYGIFEDEPDESIRENIKKFITLPKDYGDGDD